MRILYLFVLLVMLTKTCWPSYAAWEVELTAERESAASRQDHQGSEGQASSSAGARHEGAQGIVEGSNVEELRPGGSEAQSAPPAPAHENPIDTVLSDENLVSNIVDRLPRGDGTNLRPTSSTFRQATEPLSAGEINEAAYARREVGRRVQRTLGLYGIPLNNPEFTQALNKAGYEAGTAYLNSHGQGEYTIEESGT